MCSSEKMTTKTKMLSTESDSSSRYAATYSVAAPLPCVAATNSPTASPSPTHAMTHAMLLDKRAPASVQNIGDISRVQEQRRVFDEELGILMLRAVIGVGVDDQLRIRDVLLHDEGVNRGHDHVIAPVHDERGLRDRLEVVVGPRSLDAPLLHRFDLGGRHLVVHFGIAPLLTKMRALQERPSRRLACLGRTELDREPDIIGRIVGGAEEPPRSLGQRLHALTAARTGAHED